MRTQPAAVSIRGFDPADEPVAAENRQHVPPPTPLGRRHEELPHLVETEQGPEEAAVPDQRIERWDDATERGGSGGARSAARPPRGGRSACRAANRLCCPGLKQLRTLEGLDLARLGARLLQPGIGGSSMPDGMQARIRRRRARDRACPGGRQLGSSTTPTRVRSTSRSRQPRRAQQGFPEGICLSIPCAEPVSPTGRARPVRSADDLPDGRWARERRRR
jgi:hypothetical protein